MASVVSNVGASSSSAASAANQVHSAPPANSAASATRSPSTMRDDTVKISLAANIKLMHLQGMSPSVIASRLGVPVKQVDTYIPSAAPAAAPATAVAPASQAGPAPVSAPPPAAPPLPAEK